MAVTPTDSYHLHVADSPTVTGGLTSAITPADSTIALVGDAAVIADAPGLTLRVVDRADFASVLGTPEKAVSPPHVTSVLNDAGFGEFTTGLDDGNLAEIDFGRLWQVAQDGTERWTGIVEGQRRHRVTSGEEAAEVLTVSGRSHVAILESAVVEPEGGVGDNQFSDTRIFSWANPAYDDSAWVPAAALARQGQVPNPTSQWAPPYQPALLPNAWTDRSAYWMGPAVGTWEDSPDLRWYLRWTTPSLAAGDYGLDFTVDNDCLLFVDGVGVGNGGFNYRDTHNVDLSLPGGTHVIAARVYNTPKTGNNPSAFLGALWSLDDGQRDTVVARTSPGADVVALNTPTVSSATGPRFAIPVPGMTVGHVLDILLTEAQANGFVADVSWDFTASVDSASTAWPVTGEIAVKVGDDLLTVLRQLSGTYIDFTMDPDDLVLHAYVAGDYGSASGVSYTQGATLTELTADGEG